MKKLPYLQDALEFAQEVTQIHGLLRSLAMCDPWRYYWRGRDGRDHQYRKTGGFYCWFCGCTPHEGHAPRCDRRQAREALGMHNCEDLYARPGGSAPEGMPRIVCLCGSTRFADVFERENLRLTLEGHIVLSIGANVSDEELGIAQDSNVKARLDELHLRKIDLADEVLIINPGGYVGESTRREIEYAERVGKPVRSLEGIPA